MNTVAAIGGIFLLLCGMACFGISPAVPGAEGFIFALGILLVAASFGLPMWLLDKLDH